MKMKNSEKSYEVSPAMLAFVVDALPAKEYGTLRKHLSGCSGEAVQFMYKQMRSRARASNGPEPQMYTEDLFRRWPMNS